MHILPTISRSKSNQTMKLGHLIEYNKRNISIQKLCRKWGRETSSRSLFIFQKCLTWGKSKWSVALFQCISIALNLGYNKNKLYKNLDYWSKDILNFNFPEKGLWLVLHHILCIIFQEKCFLCYILLTDQVLLSDCLYFTRHWTICVSKLSQNLSNQVVLLYDQKVKTKF